MQTVRSSLRCFASMISRNPATSRLRTFTKTAFSDKFLFYTNVTISISLSATGDYIEQNYEMYIGEMDKWNQTRTLHMAFSGMTVGVVCHHWYKILDRRLPGRAFGTVIKKVLLDQFVCSPFVISLFFASVALFEDITLEDFKTELKHKFWRLYAAEWVVWPPAQIINFYLLPTKYRVLYDNTISLGYDIFTSQVKHAKVEVDAPSNDIKHEKVQEGAKIIELDRDCKSSTLQNNILSII